MTRPAVCAVVVTYRCGAAVERTVGSVLAEVDRVVIVDNGGDETTIASIEGLTTRFPEKVAARRNPANLGIAGGLNVGVREALECGFAWILTLDHDSVVPPGMVDTLLGALNRYPERNQVGILAPRYFDPRTHTEGLYPWYGGGWRARHLRFDAGGADILEPTEVISSGSLIRHDLFRRIGLFDERLFMDGVDVDFCLRTVSAGFHILVPKDAMLHHELGAAVKRVYRGRTIVVSNHSPFRRYFITRNRIYLGRKYLPAFPAFLTASVARILNDTVTILRFEQERTRKMKMIARGVLDGLRGKLGNPFAVPVR